jgi:hypothetical protein
LRDDLGGIYHDQLFKYGAAYEQFRKILELNRGTLGHRANFAEASLATERFEEAHSLARKLLTESAASETLGLSSELAMRFVAIASLVLQGRTDDADREKKEFVDRYNGVVDKYVPGWVYKGTKHFITERQMDGGQREMLLKLIEILETPTPGITVEHLSAP